MKGKKNLERAIILGLILSTSVYGSAWAQDYLDGINESNTYDNVDTIYNNASTGKAVDADNNKVIIINGEGITIDVNSDMAKQYGISVTGSNGVVNINANNGINFNLHGQGSTANNNVYGINATSSSNVQLTTKNGNIEINGGNSSNRFNDTVYRGINASGGAITLTASNGDIILKSYTAKDKAAATTFKDNTGIYASKKVDLSAQNIIIEVDADEGIAKGIHTLNKSGIVDINAANNVNISAKGEEAYGIYTYGKDSTVDISAGNDITIEAIAEKTSSNNSSYGSYAISSAYHTINLEAGNNLNLIANATDLNRAFGFWVANQGSASSALNTLSADNNVNITTNLVINNYATSLATSAGIYEQGDGEIPQTTNITAGNAVNITANAENNLTNKTVNAYGIYATTTTLNVETGMTEPEETASNTITVGASNNSQSTSSNAYGIYAYHSNELAHNTIINNQNGSTYIYGIGENKASGKGIVMDVFNNQVSDNIVNITSKYNNKVYGTHGAVDIRDEQSDLTITSSNGNNYLHADNSFAGNVILGADLNLIAEKGINKIVALQSTALNVNGNSSTAILTGFGNNINAENNGITAANNSEVSLTANNIANTIESGVTGISANNSTVSLTTNINNTIGTDEEVYSNYVKGGSNGINASSSDVIVTALQGGNYIEGDVNYGIYSTGSNVTVQAQNINTVVSNAYGIYGDKASIIDITSNKQNNIINSGNFGITSYDSDIDLTAVEGVNEISAKSYGIYTMTWDKLYDTNTVTMSGDDNIITATAGTGIYSSGETTTVDLDADTDNILYAGELAYYDAENGGGIYGNKKAIDARSGSTVTLDAGNANAVSGAVYASGKGTTVDLTSTGQNTYSTNNDIRSAAAIANAGGLSDTVISALYAEKGANISVSGERNVIRTYADYDKPEELERVVWAYDTADIKIDGASIIGTDTYEKSRNSNDIAIAAGTATNLKADDVNAPVEDRATVTLTYDNFTTNDGKQAVSEITGDILSAYAGKVDIATDNSEAGINITGNLLAGNNGILNVDLGKGGVLTGRADDYGDAGANPSGVGDGNDGHQSSEFFDPAFSSEIFKGGEVNLTMGENSRWNVTGQSWITRIKTAENSNAIIDLVGSNTDRNTTAHALTVYEMNGDANFNMNLDADRDVSDMLYIKNAKGNYVVNVIDAVTEEDMYAARTDGGTFDGLRFATVGKYSTASFRAITYDDGFNNVEYIIGSDSYDDSTENHHYNGDSLDAEKPGDSTVDDFFENDGTPGSTTGATNGLAKASLMALPVNETNNAENDDLTNVEVNTDETTNFKLIGVKNTEISDGGKTILNMSRANYSNAIYMDRLNKRLGEARYINSEEDEGMWVRIRHDRIGKDDAYRSQNTMYELGYDQKQECDNGERRVGMAIDYMHGDTGYDQIAGKGEIDRYGLWLYDTWMGDKGHYADYVAKWGHLSNDFEIYNSRGEVTGDYSNNVFSVSAEYGRKKDIGNDWYFEPQVQAQLARVTGADYTTNQGTKVSVDGINSLIGRAGFRLGKDFGEEKQSTVYIKADVLHEFLGDQDIRALDSTTNGNWQTVSYENEGTWYDVGFGFATQMSKNSYAFMDFEKSFGNDNDETYQINVGMQWSF